MKAIISMFTFLLCQDYSAQTNITTPTTGCIINTFSTNPDRYRNNSDPDSTEKWDWRQQNYTMYLTSNSEGTPGTAVTIVSPFYDQSQNPNLEGLATEFEKDFKSENGWELLYKAFGTATVGATLGQGVTTPYFALYNRFDGTVRVFANIVNSGESAYTAAAITLYYDKYTQPTRQTAVLNQLGNITISYPKAGDGLAPDPIRIYKGRKL